MHLLFELLFLGRSASWTEHSADRLYAFVALQNDNYINTRKYIYITFLWPWRDLEYDFRGVFAPTSFCFVYARMLVCVCVQRAESSSSRLNYGLFDPFIRQTATDAAHKTKSSQSRLLCFTWVCACMRRLFVSRIIQW
jgi:hypothetical protein